jgi:hypothetical protein
LITKKEITFKKERKQSRHGRTKLPPQQNERQLVELEKLLSSFSPSRSSGHKHKEYCREKDQP